LVTVEGRVKVRGQNSDDFHLAWHPSCCAHLADEQDRAESGSLQILVPQLDAPARFLQCHDVYRNLVERA
jgi:hypothetical protein